MNEPGTLRNRERARQLISFEGLRWKAITPTDGDILLDFHGRGFALGELKYRDTTVPRGQELAIERFIDTWDRGGVPSVGFIASHTVDIGDVRAADAIVRRIRWQGKWVNCSPRTVLQLLNAFEHYCVRRAA